MRKSKALLLSALVLCAAASPVLAADAPALLGILEIRGLDNLSGSAFELTKAAGQPMAREMVSMMLHGALGTMPGMGIQPNGKVRAIWMDGGAENGDIALLLPVENEGKEYLAGLGQSGWKNESETADELLHFVPPEDSGLAWSDVYFLKRGSILLAAPDAATARKADAALSSLPPILPAEGDVALQIRPAALMEAFGPKIKEEMDKAFDAQSGAPEASAEIGKRSMDIYLSVAGQLEECTFGLGVANGNLNLHTRAAPVAGSTLAKWLATVRPASAAASMVNLPGALFVETLHLGDLSLLGPAYFHYVEAMFQAMPGESGAESMAAYLENVKAGWAQLDGDVGFALLPPAEGKPFRLAEYCALKDSAAVRALTGQMVKSANAMMAAMGADPKEMPFQVELVSGEPREHRGIAVDLLTYRLTPAESVQAAWPKGVPTEFPIELAWVPGGVVASIGDASLTDALVDRALDGVAAPVSGLASWKALFPTPEPDLVDLSHVALFDAVRAYATFFAGPEAATSIPAGAGNLESCSYVALDGAMNRVRFSLADIGAVAVKIQEAQQKVLDAQMKAMSAAAEAEESEPADEEVVEELEDDGEEAEVEESPAPAAE